MRQRLLVIGVAVALGLAFGIALAIAGTSGGSDARGATVSVMRLGAAGKVLVDAKGRALYSNDQERGSMVLCVGQCVSFWKPLISSGAPKGVSLPGKLGLAKRPNGSKQVTYRGKRLYTFTLDKPGKVTGDGARDAFGGQKFTWDVVHPAKVDNDSSEMGNGGYPGYSYP